MVYRETRDPRFLAFAQKVTDVCTSNVCPNARTTGYRCGTSTTRRHRHPRMLRQRSVVASALLELSVYVDAGKGQQYRKAAENMLSSLSRNYQSGERCVSFLLHSTGHHPAGSGIDASIIYADYYYYEGLVALAPVAARTSGVGHRMMI